MYEDNQDNDKANYFLMNRKVVQDRKLSFEARGMLVYLKSLDISEVHFKDLEQNCTAADVISILKEIVDAGYLLEVKNG